MTLQNDLTERIAMRENKRKEELHRKKLLRLSNKKPSDLRILEVKKKRQRILMEHLGKEEITKEEEKKYFEMLRDLKPEKNNKLSEFI